MLTLLVPARRGDGHGFTLIEMLVAIALVGLLAAVAYPSYANVVQRARRADALSTLFVIQAAQERHRAANRHYSSDLSSLGVAASSAARHYQLRVAASGARSFEATAEAVGAQAGDETCRYLRLRVEGANEHFESGRDDQLANGQAANRECWKS